MAMYTKKTQVRIRPEWEPQLDALKQERFYKDTQAEMFRYLIRLGLETIQQESKKTGTSAEQHSA